MMAAMLALRPWWLPLVALDSHGRIDRGDPKNLLLIIPALAVFGLVQQLFHRHFNSLALADRHWPRELSVAERRLMREHKIRSINGYFACGEMHFDTLQQAVEYARAQKPRPTA